MSAERDARHEARARATGARALLFETPAPASAGGVTPAAGGKRRASEAGLREGGGEEEEGAAPPAFEGLRPPGAEAGSAQA
eukprot:2313492-Pleurochrysis_carterae.AAC.1